MSLLSRCIGQRKTPQIQEKKKKTPFLDGGVACSHGKGRLVGDQYAGTLRQRPPQDKFWEAHLLGSTDTKNHTNPELLGPSLLPGGKSLLEDRGISEESGARCGEKNSET